MWRLSVTLTPAAPGAGQWPVKTDQRGLKENRRHVSVAGR